MTAHSARSDLAPHLPTRLRLLVRGTVQGVGFRPFVYRQARALGLAGWVANSAQGVTVEVEGHPGDIASLVRTIRLAPPPGASVTGIDTCEIAPRGEAAFAIQDSETAGTRNAGLPVDVATCDACLRELFDPADRRHLYHFINCSHCGPRYSIIEAIPYDRARTSMRHFAMCRACRAEYDDPSNRRFHAEANACPACGPRLALWTGAGAVLVRDHEALMAAAAAIGQGRVVAVKGIGGFHLFVDARNEAAVQRLRQRKRREGKPFAVMFPSHAAVSESCALSALEESLLLGPARPIVLLRRTGGPIAAAAAPDNPWLGTLLPYAPLHHLLMHELGFPVVATSGNLSDEPIVTDEAEALRRLAGIADLFLVHDRPIVRPIDDSVVRVACGRALPLRRARSYAPISVAAPRLPAGILALGGHLKATVALTLEGGVVLSQHLGDLETAEARTAHVRALTHLGALHAVRPHRVVRDCHPDYASSRAAEELGLPVVQVQHHVAHIVACMVEQDVAPPVLGVAWDGTGFGPDGTVWGGEFLRITERGWERVAHLRHFRLPGGEAAAREPRRAAVGLLFEAFGEDAFALADLAPVKAFSPAERTLLRAMLARGVNAPLTSSAGRLFDAFAALAGLRQRASYEGQAALEFEGAASGLASGRHYHLPIGSIADRAGALIVDWQPALEAALADLQDGAGSGRISEALHNGLAGTVAQVARRIGEARVVLSGGCFQNARLTEATVAALRAAGHEPIWHHRVPPNDGGIALGQAVWEAWSERRGDASCA